jgi:hypothetical protein
MLHFLTLTRTSSFTLPMPARTKAKKARSDVKELCKLDHGEESQGNAPHYE